VNYLVSGSVDDPSWTPLIDLSASYTYYPTYAQVLKEYNRQNFRPVFMEEANCEFERNVNTDGGSLANLRHQEYWTMLSGATGQLYGSKYKWTLPAGWLFSWRSYLDTPGVMQFSDMRNLFAPRRWYELVPDRAHAVVTDGYGRPASLGTGSITTDTYVTAARTSDGALVIAYMPTIRMISVDMSTLSAGVTARWYDPTIGKYRREGSPFPNTGTRLFKPPSKNHVGDGDCARTRSGLGAVFSHSVFRATVAGFCSALLVAYELRVCSM